MNDRRGHWHTVLHGEKRQSRRMQWFQPVSVAFGPPAKGVDAGHTGLLSGF
jgi:hypothetical protein